MSRTLKLTVGLLESDRRLSRDGRRGADWSSPVAHGFRLLPLRTARVRRGEETHFVLLPCSRLKLGSFKAVVLGSWDSPAFWQTLLLAKLRRLPTVAFYESTSATARFQQGLIARARAWFFRRVDAVVVAGKSSRALVDTFGVDPRRIYEAFNAVDVERFAREADFERAQVRRLENGHRFVYVGQLINRKNVDGLLRAFYSTSKPGDMLTLIGDGEERARLERIAEELGMGYAVCFHGTATNAELPRLLARQDTLVLPSHREVWGLVVNEALAAGLSVVVSGSAGVAESVKGMPGVRLTDGSISSLAAEMAEARGQWNGAITNRPILAYTPERFADVFLQAIANSAAVI